MCLEYKDANNMHVNSIQGFKRTVPAAGNANSSSALPKMTTANDSAGDRVVVIMLTTSIDAECHRKAYGFSSKNR
jgi:hypothetical protein